MAVLRRRCCWFFRRKPVNVGRIVPQQPQHPSRRLATTHFQGQRARRRDDRTHGKVRRAGYPQTVLAARGRRFERGCIKSQVCQSATCSAVTSPSASSASGPWSSVLATLVDRAGANRCAYVVVHHSPKAAVGLAPRNGSSGARADVQRIYQVFHRRRGTSANSRTPGSGRSGIRTHGGPKTSTAFEAVPFVRSGILPSSEATGLISGGGLAKNSTKHGAAAIGRDAAGRPEGDG